jgi:NAD-dependent DNA ligase
MSYTFKINIKKKIKKSYTFKKEKLKKDLKINKELNKYKSLPLMIGGTKITDYKEKYIEILKKLKFYNKKYEKDHFKASKYGNAIETLKNFSDELTNSSQIKNIPNIGKAMIDKLDELIKTNKVKNLELLKEKYPEGEEEYKKEKIKEIFMEIHGIGDAIAQEIVDLNILTLEELKKRKDEKLRGKKKNLPLLTEKQQKGLIYLEETKERIPRSEIEEFEKLFKKEFIELINEKDESLENHIFEITGSYRRGNSDSGDIDVLFTAYNNNKSIYYDFKNRLVSKNIIVAELTKGDDKSMVIGKLKPESKARRIDLLYATPEERPFALLYFTGSKDFNTAMRQHALSNGVTLNEHEFQKINKNKEKIGKVTQLFKSEKDIFDYLNMEYKKPYERIDGNSVVIKPEAPKPETPKPEAPKPEAPKPEAPKPETPKPETPKPETPKPETPKPETPKPETQYNKTIKNDEYKKVKNKTIKTKQTKKSILKNIEDFKNKTKQLEVYSEDEISEMLKLINKIYYDSDSEPLLTDNQYDILRDYVLSKYPNNKYANEQHAAIEGTKDKVKLPFELWSMDKIKPDTNALEKFKEKYKEPFVISAKLDGVSALYTTNEDKPHLYTRGNGKYGQNIDHLIPFLKLPSKTSEQVTQEPIAIRGELIIKENVFKTKYSQKYKNSRNFVSGLVNKKKLSKIEEIMINDLDFVAYEVIIPTNLKPSQQFEFLETLKPNINVAKHEKNITQTQLTNEFLSEKLTNYKSNYEYTIDGIINIEDKVYPRQSKNPDHAFAFKMIITDQVVEAKVVDVIYEPSKDGYLKPKIEIEPIELDGVTITYATCFNAKYVLDNKIGLGTSIKLNRSGGVIPNILEVLTPADEPILPKIPKNEYSLNETNTDFVLKNPESNKTVILKNITGFFKKIEVEGLGEGNTSKLIAAGHNTIQKILALSKEDIESIDTFKDKMATKIHNSIQKQINKSSIARIAAASNILGRGFAEKRIELILKAYPNIFTNKLSKSISKEEKTNLIAQISSVEGLANKTATQFVEALPEFQKFLEESNLTKNKIMTLKPNKEDKSSSPNKHEDDLGKKEKTPIKDEPLVNEIIVLSDFKKEGVNKTKKEFTSQLEDLGATVEDSLTKKTTILIVGSKDVETGKIKKAKTQSNTKILTFEEFNNTYL